MMEYYLYENTVYIKVTDTFYELGGIFKLVDESQLYYTHELFDTNINQKYYSLYSFRVLTGNTYEITLKEFDNSITIHCKAHIASKEKMVEVLL